MNVLLKFTRFRIELFFPSVKLKNARLCSRNCKSGRIRSYWKIYALRPVILTAYLMALTRLSSLPLPFPAW